MVSEEGFNDDRRRYRDVLLQYDNVVDASFPALGLEKVDRIHFLLTRLLSADGG